MDCSGQSDELGASLGGVGVGVGPVGSTPHYSLRTYAILKRRILGRKAEWGRVSLGEAAEAVLGLLDEVLFRFGR